MESLPRRKTYIQMGTTTHDDDTESDSDSEKVLFMEKDTKEILDNHEGFESEGEVDLEEDIISALSELKKERKKNKKLKEELRKIKESIQDPGETKKAFKDIKVKMEEANRTEETLRTHVEEKERI